MSALQVSTLSLQNTIHYCGVKITLNPLQESNFKGVLVLYAPLEGELIPFTKVGEACSTSKLWVIGDAIQAAMDSHLQGLLEVRIPGKGGSLDASPESWLARFEAPAAEPVENFDPDAKDEYTDRR
jgi:hypothetical protein